MPYLGNTPSTSFATVVKDSFNGGSTAYTLSKVATTNSVSVFVENVRQEPTTAYAVSGTTLTFTATTPSGTGNIYVLHMNPTTTTTHPAAQALTATTGTFTSTVDINGSELILDADADTSITADTDDQIDIKIAGADDFQLTANTFTALSGSSIATNTISETTSGSGVTIDSVLLKDGGIDVNGNEIILDADADTSITADTDDRIDFRFGGTDSVHMDVTGVGVNLTNPLYPFHARAASGGDTAALFLEGPNDGYSALYMGDTDTINQASIIAYHTNETLDFTVGGSSTFRMGAGGNTGTSAGACILESRRNVTLADDASYSLTLKIGISVLSSTSNGEGALFHHYYSGQPNRVSDPNAFCDSSDTDGRLCLFKSTSSSHTYTVKNRRGAQYSINLMSFSTSI